jgi:hypothetical protein
MRFLRFFPGLLINLFAGCALVACVALAFLLDRLAPFFQSEWTLWTALVVFLGAFIALARFRKRRIE